MLRTGEVGSSSFPRRITVAAVVAAVALVPVAGCGSPEPSPVESKTAKPRPKTPTSTPSPTPSKSASPNATGPVEEQLHAATIAFYAAVNKAYEALDPAPIEALTVQGSGAGRRYIDYIKSVKQKGHRFAVKPELRVRDFKLQPQDADTQFESATFTLVSAGTKEVDGAGKTVNNFPPGSAKRTIEFQKKGETWRVLSQR